MRIQGGESTMKDHRMLLEIAVVFVVATLAVGGHVADAVSHAGGEDQDQTACREKLRATMDEMHAQMHSVKPSGDVDEDFVRLMLPHHEGAVEMAKVELLCGKDPINRRLAQEIIVEQQSEIDLMRLWLSKHGPQKPSNHADHRKEESRP